METTDTLYIDDAMLASSGKRFANNFIDTIVFYIVIFGIHFVAGALSSFGMDGMLIWVSEMSSFGELMFNMSILFLYPALMESASQRTLGKYITGTKVVMEDGSKPDITNILLRSLCRFIPFDPFSYIGNKRGWHDSLSKTYVVDVKKYNEALALRNSFSEIGSEEL